MEEQIYNRQVTKQAMAMRVTDEKETPQHFSKQEVQQLLETARIDAYSDADEFVDGQKPASAPSVDDVPIDTLGVSALKQFLRSHAVTEVWLLSVCQPRLFGMYVAPVSQRICHQHVWWQTQIQACFEKKDLQELALKMKQKLKVQQFGGDEDDDDAHGKVGVAPDLFDASDVFEGETVKDQLLHGLLQQQTTCGWLSYCHKHDRRPTILIFEG